jgi:hypothetical protein
MDAGISRVPAEAIDAGASGDHRHATRAASCATSAAFAPRQTPLTA